MTKISIYIISVIADLCLDMQCGGKCLYANQYNDFVCTCPENWFLNVDGTSCVTIQNNPQDEVVFGDDLSEPEDTTTFKLIEEIHQNPPSTTIKIVVDTDDNKSFAETFIELLI